MECLAYKDIKITCIETLKGNNLGDLFKQEKIIRVADFWVKIHSRSIVEDPRCRKKRKYRCWVLDVQVSLLAIYGSHRLLGLVDMTKNIHSFLKCIKPTFVEFKYEGNHSDSLLVTNFAKRKLYILLTCLIIIG